MLIIDGSNLLRDQLTDSGVLYVPILDKNFNKSGEELNTHKLEPISYYNHMCRY